MIKYKIRLSITTQIKRASIHSLCLNRSAFDLSFLFVMCVLFLLFYMLFAMCVCFPCLVFFLGMNSKDFLLNIGPLDYSFNYANIRKILSILHGNGAFLQRCLSTCSSEFLLLDKIILLKQYDNTGVFFQLVKLTSCLI